MYQLFKSISYLCHVIIMIIYLCQCFLSFSFITSGISGILMSQHLFAPSNQIVKITTYWKNKQTNKQTNNNNNNKKRSVLSWKQDKNYIFFTFSLKIVIAFPQDVWGKKVIFVTLTV